jgi:hypothetical protein
MNSTVFITGRQLSYSGILLASTAIRIVGHEENTLVEKVSLVEIASTILYLDHGKSIRWRSA